MNRGGGGDSSALLIIRGRFVTKNSGLGRLHAADLQRDRRARAGRQEKAICLSQVIFDEVIYPRHEHDPALVQKYAECLDEIEAKGNFISVSEDMKLLDGKHRWLGYRKAYPDEDREITAFVYPVTAPHDQLKLAAKLNSDHGYQLTSADKESTAKALYAYGCSYEEIAASLSVGKKKVSEWLSRIVKDEKEKRNQKIIEMWMACYSTDEIAETCNCSKGTVSEVCSEKFQETFLNKPAANHLTDFTPPIYNATAERERDAKKKQFARL